MLRNFENWAESIPKLRCLYSLAGNTEKFIERFERVANGRYSL